MTSSTAAATESDETELWFTTNGAVMMRCLGVQSGDTVVDFGCGPGRYTVPLSQVVGYSGRVYAIDRDSTAIETTQQRLRESKTANAVQIFQTDALELPHVVAEGSINAVFLFDVLQYVSDWGLLFSALKRAINRGGCLHVYPAALPHPGAVDIGCAIERLQPLGFVCHGAQTFRMMHNVHFLEDTVHTFRRT